jgi:hypothetical protein
MAYSFNGTDQSLSTASTPVTAPPFTMFVQLNAAATGTARAFTITRSTSNDRFVVQPSGASFPLAAQFEANVVSVGTGIAILNAAISQNTWIALTGITSGIASRFVFGNDTKSVENVTSRTVPTTDMIIRLGNQAANFFNGLLAEAAIWDVVLTDDEVASLAQGFKPSRVRPQSLQFYAPIVRELRDLRGGLTLTNNNTATVANHPRVY